MFESRCKRITYTFLRSKLGNVNVTSLWKSLTCDLNWTFLNTLWLNLFRNDRRLTRIVMKLLFLLVPRSFLSVVGLCLGTKVWSGEFSDIYRCFKSSSWCWSCCRETTNLSSNQFLLSVWLRWWIGQLKNHQEMQTFVLMQWATDALGIFYQSLYSISTVAKLMVRLLGHLEFKTIKLLRYFEFKTISQVSLHWHF